MTNHAVRFFGILTAFATLVACSSDSSESPDLVDTSFTSTEVEGHELVDGTEVSLAFTDDGITAEAGCNTYSSSATWEDGQLDVADPMAATMMVCDDALNEQDQWLSQFLLSSPELTVDGDTVVLNGSGTSITLTESG